MTQANDSELHRLLAWMAEHGHDAVSLAETIGFRKFDTQLVIAGKRPISCWFRTLFLKAFGREALSRAFGITLISGESISQQLNAAQVAAQRDMQEAIKTGELLHPSNYHCHGCGKPAVLYHHPSYHEDDGLCVVPLCKRCHQQVHLSDRAIDFGVVPTAVGVVRIAISTGATNVAAPA